jgi:metal-responsive CopG/Arc/MetJ family transcriptional regulator
MNVVLVQLRLDKDLLERVDDLAHFEHLSRSDWVRSKLEKAVEEE